MEDRKALMKGLGSDLVEIERIRNSVDRYGAHFLNRLFTQKEQDYALSFKDPAPHLAGRFAAKEAIAKALGTGIGEQLSWHDIEIVNDALGKPVPILSARVIEHFGQMEILLSITHTKEYAFAVAIAESL